MLHSSQFHGVQMGVGRVGFQLTDTLHPLRLITLLIAPNTMCILKRWPRGGSGIFLRRGIPIRNGITRSITDW